MRQSIQETYEEFKKNPIAALLFLAFGWIGGFAAAKYWSENLVSVEKAHTSVLQSQIIGYKEQVSNLSTSSSQLNSELSRCQARPNIMAEDELGRCKLRLAGHDSASKERELAISDDYAKKLAAEQRKYETETAKKFAACSDLEKKHLSMPNDFTACNAKLNEVSRSVDQTNSSNRQLNSELARYKTNLKNNDAELQKLLSENRSLTNKYNEFISEINSCRATIPELQSQNRKLVADRQAGAKDVSARARYRVINQVNLRPGNSEDFLGGAVTLAVDYISHGTSGNFRSNAISRGGSNSYSAGQQILFSLGGKNYVFNIDKFSTFPESAQVTFGERID